MSGSLDPEQDTYRQAAQARRSGRPDPLRVVLAYVVSVSVLVAVCVALVISAKPH
ncbi:hypothetical protein ACWC5I_00435 [Kitasatospora sp. NPDC001574]